MGINFLKKFLIVIVALAIIWLYLSGWLRQLLVIVTDSEVRKAWMECRDEDSSTKLECHTKHAISSQNPSICFLENIYVDDLCMQIFYEAAGDAAMCDKLPLTGIAENCKRYFLNGKRQKTK